MESCFLQVEVLPVFCIQFIHFCKMNWESGGFGQENQENLYRENQAGYFQNLIIFINLRSNIVVFIYAVTGGMWKIFVFGWLVILLTFIDMDRHVSINWDFIL